MSISIEPGKVPHHTIAEREGPLALKRTSPPDLRVLISSIFTLISWRVLSFPVPITSGSKQKIDVSAHPAGYSSKAVPASHLPFFLFTGPDRGVLLKTRKE